jgi:hypothetical protein
MPVGNRTRHHFGARYSIGRQGARRKSSHGSCPMPTSRSTIRSPSSSRSSLRAQFSLLRATSHGITTWTQFRCPVETPIPEYHFCSFRAEQYTTQRWGLAPSCPEVGCTQAGTPGSHCSQAIQRLGGARGRCPARSSNAAPSPTVDKACPCRLSVDCAGRTICAICS